MLDSYTLQLSISKRKDSVLWVRVAMGETLPLSNEPKRFLEETSITIVQPESALQQRISLCVQPKRYDELACMSALSFL